MISASRGGDVSDCLSVSNNYWKSTKLAKIRKKAYLDNLTALQADKLT